MSRVTTVVLLTSIMEDNVEHEVQGEDGYPSIDALNQLMGACWFKPVHHYAGGNKYPQAYVFMAAINHLDLVKLKAAMRSVQWVYPEHVTVMVNEEEELGFHVEPWR